MPKSWELSRQIQRDNNDDYSPLAKAYFYQAGTTTPYVVYEDSDLTTPHDDPVRADGNGRWPRVFIPFTASGYRERVVTAGGVQLWDDDDIPNADPIEASEDSVDDAELIATGMTVWEPVDTTRTGFVRLNGRTIGSAASGASERANADTSDLYAYLWNNLANGQAAVSTGRGANAAADFAANKTIALLDVRGALLGGLDTMGNSAASLLGAAPVINGSTILPGSILGANTHTLTSGESAAHTHSFSATTGADGVHTHTATTGDQSASHTHTGATGNANQDHTHLYLRGSVTTGAVQSGSGATAVLSFSETSTASVGASTTHAHAFTSDAASNGHTHTLTTSGDGSHTHTVSGTSGSSGSGGAHNNLSRVVLGTWYQKL